MSSVNQPTDTTPVVTILDAPSSAEVIASLSVGGNDQGRKTLLATVECGPYTAELTRWDELDDDGTPIPGRPQIEMDSADQEGLEMFHDLVVLGHQTDDFFEFVSLTEAVVAVVGGAVTFQRDEGAFEGEFHICAGLTAAPEIHTEKAGGISSIVTWFENDRGDRNTVDMTLDVRTWPILTPAEAKKFGAQIKREATLAEFAANGVI